MAVTIETRDGGIAVVTVDNPPVNALSAAVRQGLVDAVATLDADPAVRGVVLNCAGRTFMAGADVREFGQPPKEPHLPDVVARIEGARAPWCAAIHGTALGGGLEVALGCRFRVAAADARLGLPEVTLGILPGAGGTVRTPRLVGMEAAVELVTGGKPVGAAKARGMGLVDAVAEGDVTEAAIRFLDDALTRDLPPPASARALAPAAAGFWDAAAGKVAKAAKGAAAPGRALDQLRAAEGMSFADALTRERETFVELRDSDQAAALRHVFFAERGAGRPERLKGVEPRRLSRVGVIGGGTMGAGIAAALRDAGIAVVLIERDEASLAAGVNRLRGIFDAARKRGLLDDAAHADRLAGVTPATEYAALADADLVIEAVFEDLAVKQEVFTRLGAACREDAILATNTSYLDPRRITAGVPGPERMIGLHFFSPANIMKLLEVVPLPDTAPEVLATAMALATRLKKIPVISGICDGFIGNRILKRYRGEAELLVRDGVSPAEVDAAMRDYGMAMGPFEMSDLAGLDIAWMQRRAARERGEDVAPMLADLLVEAGRKGQKTGGGWYDYAEGDRTPRPSPDADALIAGHTAPRREMPREEIARRIVGAMAAEGRAILDEGIAAQASDIDLVEIHGYGFPRWRGGPMFAADR